MVVKNVYSYLNGAWVEILSVSLSRRQPPTANPQPALASSKRLYTDAFGSTIYFN